MWNTHLVLELVSFLAVNIVPVMLPCFTIFIRNTNFTRWFVFQHTIQYLFQFRVNLSPLRSHKSRHNFADIPEFCECNQGVECTRHLLFECPRYTTHRATLAVSVIDILQRNNLNHLGNQLELYLYGHPSLNLMDNRQILLSTIKHIKDTKRSSLLWLKKKLLENSFRPWLLTKTEERKTSEIKKLLC